MQWTVSLLRWFKQSGVVARLPLYVGILFVVLGGFGWLKSYLLGPDTLYTTLYRYHPRPARAIETKLSEQMKEVPKCIETVVKVPTPKQVEKLEVKYDGQGIGLDLQHVDLLGEFKIPKAPYGGDVLVTSTPKGADVIFAPKPQPLFELWGQKGIGIGYGRTQLGNSWRVRYYQDVVRTGPVWWTGEASFGDRGDGKAHWSALIEGSIRF